ncbi:hypothetical protein KL86CLO1_12297 [uncultured Eubacteriales bacterium]|uniref:Uncharacterized protein n=1 Tax=uncultured Eubacteriales bacterium TaxID=172733 RepID=A0A212K6R2_9FIRM|nr:hypothetical protein KL86CLO1_12297 [uncultured Eubacteriales bacterium]
MADLGSRGGAGHRGGAGVGEEVEHPDGPARTFDLARGKIPVGGLLGEKAGVLKIHGLDVEGQAPVPHRPALRGALDLPLAAPGGGAGVPGIGLLPPPVGALGLPDGLRVGTYQRVLPPALQLFPAAAVDELIILPLIGNPHIGFLRLIAYLVSIIPLYHFEAGASIATVDGAGRPKPGTLTGKFIFDTMEKNKERGEAP